MVAVALLALPLLAVASAAPFKRAESQQIHLNGDTSKCLSVQNLADGSPVVNVPCNNGFHNAWTVQEGNNAQGVRLTGTSFCLDAGSNPGNFGLAKIWTCYPGLKQQTWWYTVDQHLAITDGDQCLDVGQDHVQTYECFCDNTNQIWTLSGSAPPPPTGPTAPTQPETGRYIFFHGSSTGCVTSAMAGPLVIDACKAINHPWIDDQLWNITRNTPGPIFLQLNKAVCLDASPDGLFTNGSPVTLKPCEAGLKHQQWYYTDDNHLAVLGGNQCLDVRTESPAPRQVLQTWQCDGLNTQQVFVV